VVFLPRVPIFTPLAPLAAYGKNCLGPAEPCSPARLLNRERYHAVA
jgi:hypothetical protein